MVIVGFIVINQFVVWFLRVDYLGDENANTLTGTRSDEIFVAGAGNDILTGNGGMDVFNAIFQLYQGIYG